MSGVNLTVTELTDRLIASYALVGGINHLDGKNLPSKTAIGSITCDSLRLLFPGFFDEKSIHSSQLKMEIATLMDSVLERLEEEVYKSLEYASPEKLTKKDTSRLAHSLTLDFLSNLPRVRDLLQTDTEAAFQGDPAALSREEIIVAYPFIEAIAVQRLAHELYGQKVPLIPRIMTEWAHGRTGMDLHPGARIGSYFFIDHGTGTVIGETWRSSATICQALPGCWPRRPFAGWRADFARPQAPSHYRGQCDDLRQRDDCWRRNDHWRGEHHWGKRVSELQRPAKLLVVPTRKWISK